MKNTTLEIQGKIYNFSDCRLLRVLDIAEKLCARYHALVKVVTTYEDNDQLITTLDWDNDLQLAVVTE